MRGRRLDPHHLDVEVFAERAAESDGSLSMDALRRLAELAGAEPVADPLADPADPVQWQARGERRVRRGHGPQSWLHLGVQARLAMICQRCLQPMPVPLSLERNYRFVVDEAAAADADIDAEEDLLATTRSLDLVALIEDELLMALPIVPRHDGVCPQPLVAPALDAALDLAVEPARQNPFEALAALKLPKSRA